MSFHINKKILKLSILGQLIIFNPMQASSISLDGTIDVKNLEADVLKRGQDDLCRPDGAFCRSKGNGCAKSVEMATLSLVTCKGVQDFNKSECHSKATAKLGNASAETLKQNVITNISENPIYNQFFCGSAHAIFTGHLKEIASHCPGKGQKLPSGSGFIR